LLPCPCVSLLTDLIQHQRERLRTHRGQHARQARDRRLHQEQQLGDQRLAAGQRGDVLDLVRPDRPPLDHAALELDRRHVLGEVGQRLGQGDRVLVGERHGGGTHELVLERLERGPVDGAQRERVLHHQVLAAALAHLLAQRRDLRDLDPLVAHQERMRRALQALFVIGEQLLFVGSTQRHDVFLLDSYASAATATVSSTLMPGPMVEQRLTPLTYLPLAALGLALTTAPIRASAFSFSLSVPKDSLPTGAWMIPVLSTRNSTLPALISWTALATSTATVPAFGFGIRPRGPRTLPRRPTTRIMSGVATTASKSSQPPSIRLASSSPPTKSAPASSASRIFSPAAKTRTRAVLPRPFGRTTVPRTIWSACLGSTPRRSETSTVSSNFANFTFWIKGTASSIVWG